MRNDEHRPYGTCNDILVVRRFIARKTAKATSFHAPLFRGFCLRSVIAVSLRGISGITSIFSAYEDVPNTAKGHIQHILGIGYVVNSSILMYTAGEWSMFSYRSLYLLVLVSVRPPPIVQTTSSVCLTPTVIYSDRMSVYSICSVLSIHLYNKNSNV